VSIVKWSQALWKEEQLVGGHHEIFELYLINWLPGKSVARPFLNNEKGEGDAG
jgi:hypothetical protein